MIPELQHWMTRSESRVIPPSWPPLSSVFLRSEHAGVGALRLADRQPCPPSRLPVAATTSDPGGSWVKGGVPALPWFRRPDVLEPRGPQGCVVPPQAPGGIALPWAARIPRLAAPSVLQSQQLYRSSLSWPLPLLLWLRPSRLPPIRIS